MYRSTVNEVPEVYSGPFRRRRDQQKTLLILANEVAKLDGRQAALKSADEKLANIRAAREDRSKRLGITISLPQESMQTTPDPDYMDQPHGPNWRATHD